MKRATIKRVDADAIKIKGHHTDEKSDDKEDGCRSYTDQGPAERE